MTNKIGGLAALSPIEKRALLARLLERREGSGFFPLSFGQERLWFIEQLDPGNAAYNSSRILHMAGNLDLPSLRNALAVIIARHEALRTTFVVTADGPRQRIAAPAPAPIPVIDLSLLPDKDRSCEADRIARWETSRPFCLEEGPLLRLLILRLDYREHVVIFTVHHIISDALSIAIFSGELGVLYQAYQAGISHPLPTLPIQYKDYALWQRKLLSGEQLDAQMAYWRHQLRGAPLLNLSLDHPRPQNPSHVGAMYDFTLSEAASEWCREFSRGRQVTPFIALLSIFLVQLRYYSGQDDITVGTDVANRTHLEMEALIGYFANQVVLRARFDGSYSFRELVAGVHQVVRDALANQDLPFDKLVEVLRPDRNPGMNPLFQVMFLYQTSPPALYIPDLQLTNLGLDNNTAAFDLTMQITETQHGLIGSVRYDSRLFERDTIRRMIEHHQLLIEGVQHANPRVEQLSLMLASYDQERISRARKLRRMNLARSSVK